MPHVVTDNCQGCRYTECVSVCPVECFHQDETMTYIDPDVCIDCGGCIPACPVNAIYDSYNLSEASFMWEAINREKSKILPVIAAPVDALPGADKRKEALGL